MLEPRLRLDSKQTDRRKQQRLPVNYQQKMKRMKRKTGKRKANKRNDNTVFILSILLGEKIFRRENRFADEEKLSKTQDLSLPMETVDPPPSAR